MGDWGDKFLVGLVHSWDLKNFLGLSGERTGRGQGLSIFIDLHVKLVKHEKKGEMNIPLPTSRYVGKICVFCREKSPFRSLSYGFTPVHPKF